MVVLKKYVIDQNYNKVKVCCYISNEVIDRSLEIWGRCTNRCSKKVSDSKVID